MICSFQLRYVAIAKGLDVPSSFLVQVVYKLTYSSRKFGFSRVILWLFNVQITRAPLDGETSAKHRQKN